MLASYVRRLVRAFADDDVAGVAHLAGDALGLLLVSSSHEELHTLLLATKFLALQVLQLHGHRLGCPHVLGGSAIDGPRHTCM